MGSAFGTKAHTIQGGLHFSLQKQLQPVINKIHKDNDGRLIKVDCTLSNTKFTLINVYCPNDHTERKSFLENLVHQVPHGHYVILGGDFNCVDNPALDKIGGRDRVGASSRPLLQRITAKADLKDVFRSLNPDTKSCTYFSHSAGVQSRLDRFLHLQQAMHSGDALETHSCAQGWAVI
jgi:exonuclease III